MPKITHPSLGRAGAKSAQQTGPQSYVVDDATSKIDPSTIEEQIKRFEGASEHAGPPMGPPVQIDAPKPPNPNKAKLESILFIGRLTRDVDIDGHKFVLSTLTNKEHNMMVKELYKFGDGADLFTIRVLTLANALKSIDDVSLNDIDVDGEFENDFYRRMAILDNMQLAIIEKLYDEYSELVGEEENLSESEEVKK